MIKVYVNNNHKILCVSTDAKKIMNRQTQSIRHDTYPKKKTNYDDCAFGSLRFFLCNDKQTNSDIHQFLK